VTRMRMVFMASLLRAINGEDMPAGRGSQGTGVDFRTGSR
jgi:hypothetical protein